MKSKILRATSDAEEVVVTAARNDYLEEWVGDMSFQQVLDSSSSQTKEEFIERNIMERQHFGPLEHVSMTVSFEGVSRVCMAQVTRHRHATFDVQSLRYTTPGEDETITLENVDEYITVPPAIQDADEAPKKFFRGHCYESFRAYQKLLSRGIPAEEARFALPLATKINLVVTMNARHILHILDMRRAGDAQNEAQEFAGHLLSHGQTWMPTVFEYYDEEMSPRKNRLAP